MDKLLPTSPNDVYARLGTAPASVLALQCEGLLAISYGLSANCPDDHQMLEPGIVIYDALYKWCRLQIPARTTAEKIIA